MLGSCGGMNIGATESGAAPKSGSFHVRGVRPDCSDLQARSAW